MASIRARLRVLLEKATNLHIYRTLPRGIDPLYDMQWLLPKSLPGVVFDVGANVGQSTIEYVKYFPGARIYCFEPVSSTYAELKMNVSCFKNVSPFQLGFSRAKGRANMKKEECSSLQSLIPAGADVAHPGESVECVELDTLDDFCAKNSVKKIGFLKIDTEGHDFEVLKGADEMLAKQRIDIVQVEAGVNPMNSKFVPFEEFKLDLEKRGYYLFGIYEQVHEHYTKQPHLRRINPVFISGPVIELNRLD